MVVIETKWNDGHFLKSRGRGLWVPAFRRDDEEMAFVWRLAATKLFSLVFSLHSPILQGCPAARIFAPLPLGFPCKCIKSCRRIGSARRKFICQQRPATFVHLPALAPGGRRW